MENRSNRIWHIVIIWLTFVGCTLGADTKSANPLSIGEHTVELNGIKLWYKVSGTGPVCLMPSPAQGYSSLLYVRTLGCMEKLFTMVYLDCRGTGQSGRAPALNQYTWDDLVGDLDALRDHLHQETIWLMGNSSAGHQSLHYACKHPDRVDGLVLLCAYAFSGPEMRQLIDKRLDRMKGDPRYDDGIKAWHARWAEENRLSTSELSALSDEENEKLSEAYFTLYWSDPRLIKQWEWAFEGDTRSVEGTAGEEASNRDKADLRGELKKVKAPVLIVVGGDDFACGPDVAYYLHLELPNSKLLLIEDAGHFPWLEQPSVFEARVPEFLQAMGLSVPRPAESAQVPEIEDKLPIIDMHAHAFAANGEKDYYGNPSPGDDDVLCQQTLDAYKKWNVVKAVVSGSLEYVEMWKSRDVDNRIIRGILMFSPEMDSDWGGIEIGRFEKLVKNGKIEVFGEIGAIYGGTTLSDSGYQPYLEICAQYDIPVCIHTGGLAPDVHSWAPKARLSLGSPYLIEDVLVRYPKLRVFMAHAGVHYHEDALAMLCAYPNLYADVSCLLWINPICKRHGREFLEKAKEDRYLDRVMFGSDQIRHPHAIGMSIEYLNSLDFLSDQDKRDILYNNAARFLRLEE